MAKSLTNNFEGASIEILKWSEYNPRTDAKRPSWFRMEKDVALGSRFFGLDCEQKWLWVTILSLVCERNGESINWNSAYIKAITGISENKQFQTMEIFEKSGILRVSRTGVQSNIGSPCVSRTGVQSNIGSPFEFVRDSHATNERTNERDVTNETLRDETYLNLPGRSPTNPVQNQNSPTWESYRDSYKARYGEPPVRNAKVNAMISNFVKRIGAEEAPRVVEFFLTHNDAFYVKSLHAVSLMLRDAEKLRTEWATGTRMLGTIARNVERRQHNSDAVDEAARIVNEKREKNEAFAR